MNERLVVSTRKGLFILCRSPHGAWAIERVAFLGDSVSLSFYDASERILYAALGLGHFGVKLRRSRDLGATWDDLAAPEFPPHPEGKTDLTPDGKPWPWRVEQIWSLEKSNHGDLWCGTIGGGLFVSKDGGQSWSLNRPLWDMPERKRWFGGGNELPGIHSIVFDPRDDRSILIGVSCGGIWRTEDAGATWAVSSHGMFADFMPPELRFDPGIQDVHRLVRCAAQPDRLWAQHHNGVFRSDDGGRAWISIEESAPAVFGFAVAVHPKNGDRAWRVPAIKDEQRVPVDGKVVVSRTDDAGKSWNVLRDGLPQEHAYDISLRHALDVGSDGERLAFASTTGSLWISENGGEKWAHVSAHLPPVYAVRFA